MTIVEVREKIPNDVFTALELNACLAGYCHKGGEDFIDGAQGRDYSGASWAICVPGAVAA